MPNQGSEGPKQKTPIKVEGPNVRTTLHIHCEMDDGLSMLGSWIVATNSFAAMSSVSNPAMAESAAPQDAPAPVDGYLSYAITVNMKVGGTLGNEDSIVVESSTLAVAKSAPAFAFGLLALDRHVEGGGERERKREKEKKGKNGHALVVLA